MAERLIISRKAYLDIDRIIEFNNHRNKSDVYSKRFVKGLFSAFKLLSTQPLIGIPTNQSTVFVLIWTDYYIFYTYNRTGIIVNAIYHHKEDVMP
jgi:plasmid stabilization system protein ParE